MSYLRSVRFALILARANPIRLLMTGVLVAVALFGFMATSALADLAARQLTDAEQRINSGSGNYKVAVGSSTSLEMDALIGISRPVVERIGANGLFYVETFEYSASNCHSRVLDGDRLDLLFVYGAQGQALSPERSHSDAIECIDQQVFEDLWGQTTGGDTRQAWGDGVVLPPEFRDVVRDASTHNPSLTIVFTIDRPGDHSAVIRDQLTAALEQHSQHLGIPVFAGISDAADPHLERAVRGAVIVYSVIGSAVLLVGGVAILVVQTFVWKTRSWLVGLARSVGATRRHIAVMVMADTLVVVLLAMALSVGGVIVAQPSIADFAQRAFHTHIDLAPAAGALRLAIAVVGIAVVGGLAPMLRVLRVDPVNLIVDH